MDDALPSWDLTELYTDDEATRQADLADVRQKADALSVNKGNLASQPAEILANVIASYQKISETLSRMMSHADLA
ncbi:MAG: oligoendopeptidase F, partial [Pseudomonadota bacterium]|nr:oligoendopeptidase F [Pseudomonadota bacterium]